jgi:flavin-binding protein dodecin
MNLNTNDIYVKIQQLDRDVKEQLKRQGIVVPVRKNDGTIQVGHYRIKRDKAGFYKVLTSKNEVIVENINLPQTAAILANRLALGKWLDDDVISADTKYGHALFDETLHRQLAEKSLKSKNIEKAEVMYTKTAIDKHKKNQYKLELDRGFEKLMRFR